LHHCHVYNCCVETIFNTKFVCMTMNCLHIIFQVPRSNDSLIIAIKSKTVENSCSRHVVVLRSTNKDP